VDDNAVKTVVYENHPAAKQLGKKFHRLPPPAILSLQQDHGTGNRWKSSTECGVKDFRQLQVWQKAHRLTWAVYRITAGFPREELYGLTTQLRRSSSSISANLAEGCGRNGDAELARFCSIAMGSASELDYHLLLARDLKLINSKDYEQLAQQTTEIKRMLTGLLQKLTAES
jgi:four helix bundle protein